MAFAPQCVHRFHPAVPGTHDHHILCHDSALCVRNGDRKLREVLTGARLATNRADSLPAQAVQSNISSSSSEISGRPVWSAT